MFMHVPGIPVVCEYILVVGSFVGSWVVRFVGSVVRCDVGVLPNVCCFFHARTVLYQPFTSICSLFVCCLSCWLFAWSTSLSFPYVILLLGMFTDILWLCGGSVPSLMRLLIMPLVYRIDYLTVF